MLARSFAVAAAALALAGAIPIPVALAAVPALGAHNKVASQIVEHQGTRAVQLRDLGGGGEDRMALLDGVCFLNGELRLRLAGELGPDAGPNDRGFVGIAFRVSEDLSTFEGVYLRPTNGRAADPVRRSRAVQYHSVPEWGWQRLRRESPGVYESGADIGAAEWIDLRIAVFGTRAEIFVGDGVEPELIVRDLKLGADLFGGVALWVGPGTIAHFSDVAIRPAASDRAGCRPSRLAPGLKQSSTCAC